MSQDDAVLGDVATVVDCEHRTAPRADPGTEFGFSVGTSNVRDGRLLLNHAKPVNEETFSIWTRRAVPQFGDLIFSREAPMGEVGEVPPNAALCLGQRTVLLQLRADLIDRKYLKNLIMSPATQQWTAGNAAGTTVLHLNVADVRRIPLGTLPPVDEQRGIVEMLEDHLSRLDAAATQVEAVQRRLELWKRLALDQLVHEQASGSGRLADVVERVEAGRSFGGSAPPAGPEEWGIVKVSAMTWGSFRAHENKAVPADKVDPRYEIQPGDVLVSRANTTEYVGAPVLVGPTRRRLLLSDKSLRIIPRHGVDRAWLATVLGTRTTRRQVSSLATGTKDSMRNISQSSLLSVEVPVASACQQREVVARAALIEDRASRLDNQLSKTFSRGQTLRRSLLAAAFSGGLT